MPISFSLFICSWMGLLESDLMSPGRRTHWFSHLRDYPSSWAPLASSLPYSEFAGCSFLYLNPISQSSYFLDWHSSVYCRLSSEYSRPFPLSSQFSPSTWLVSCFRWSKWSSSWVFSAILRLTLVRCVVLGPPFSLPEVLEELDFRHFIMLYIRELWQKNSSFITTRLLFFLRTVLF